MYAVFAVVVSVLGFLLIFLAPKSLNAAIVPFTGWGAGSGYMFTLFFVFALIFVKRVPRRTAITWRFAIIAILLISIFSGYLQMKRAGGNDFGNPYLKISPWQPVWTMVIPAFWVMTLLSPRVNKYYKSLV